MKYAEMNDNQKQVFKLVLDQANELVGGLENNIDDGCDDATASKALLDNHDELVKQLVIWVRTSDEWKAQDNLHLVTLDWMKERCEKRITKMGY